VAAGLFLAGGALGAADPDRLLPFIRALGEIDLPEAYPLRVLRIFLHNVIASYAAVWLGRAWGIFPALTALLNGAVSGAVLTMAAGRVPGGGIVAAVVPHAVFELPAAFLALGLGLWVGAASWPGRTPARRTRRQRRANLAFIHLVVPLLVLAALIESR
jgi:uncharacterized membrane protein SpoIIM required for sporulation